MLTFGTYQKSAVTTAIYPKQWRVYYPAMGLSAEAGEVANKVKKIMRDGKYDRDAIAAEIGDVLWYCAALAEDMGFLLEDIAEQNLNKLYSRKERNVLSGSGDER
jgi:NTP pyrophosphatase (non-canonical NTP hydrolase)